jgi:pyrroloquinoline quinone (PQQ) biosynthesis protein C
MRMSALRKTVEIAPAVMMEGDEVDRFRGELNAIADEHRPSRMPFFRRLAEASPDVARSPALLGRVHLIYQSAMHATRAAVYHLPHLDSPAMRKRKLQIFIDDDGLPGGDTHHYQLTRAFRRMGARLLLNDEEFGSASELVPRLDGETAKFVHLVPELYARSLGPWCIVEVLSDDWMRALADALAKHFPWVVDEPYFAECFAQAVEERHAEESLAVTELVLRARPQLRKQTLADAATMAEALDGVWVHLEKTLRGFQ